MGALLFGVFKFYKYLTENNGPPSILSSNYDNLDESEKEALSMLSKSKEHIPYEYASHYVGYLLKILLEIEWWVARWVTCST